MALKVGPFELAVAAGGIVLIFSAVQNATPAALLRRSLGATDEPPPPIYERIELSSGTADPNAFANPGDAAGVSVGTQTGDAGKGAIEWRSLSRNDPAVIRNGPLDLVAVPNNPSHKLQRAAAVAFDRAQRIYGRPIYITGGYRSAAAQAAGQAAAPGRFTSVGASYHVRGLAVDVDLARTGAGKDWGSAKGGRNLPGDAQYERLKEAMRLAGWCFIGVNSRGVYEPWHFSYGGCG